MLAQIEVHLEQLESIFSGRYADLSPQLARKLQALLESSSRESLVPIDLIHKISSVFKRLLIELIQIQYNTKQREEDAKRLFQAKNCTILDPNLSDLIINSLVRLYKANISDTSYERGVLIKYLMNEFRNEGYDNKKQVEKIIQTLYRCSCFDIMPMVGSPVRLKLKSELCSEIDVRLKHDFELIKLAHSNYIRLTPESWAYLLYRNCNQDLISRMQSLIDKDKNPPTVGELEHALSKTCDKYNIGSYIDDLKGLEFLIDQGTTNSVDEALVCNSLMRLTRLSNLFSIRQNRRRLTN